MRLVIKLGSSTVAVPGLGADPARLAAHASAIGALRAGGHEVVVVSSGAVACGRALVGAEAASVVEKQQLAAIGQPLLMRRWQEALDRHGLLAAQILLTRADLERRRGYLNARGTLLGLLRRGVVPIVNENDSVATEEIRLGDNDTLSARVAAAIEAELLILLTDREAMFDRNPASDPKARPVREVPPGPLPEALRRAAGGAGPLGSGGMASKLEAALLARRAGCAVVIASGADAGNVLRIAAGEAVGTRFHPEGEPLAARKRFLLALTPAAGGLRIDAGARAALAAGGSLLTVGLRGVEGDFGRGDAVRVYDPEGRECARGLANYDAADLARLCGRRSGEIASILGYHYGDEAIHRDHLVLL